MHTAGPAVAHFLFQGTAGEIEPCLVEEGAELVWARHPDHHGRCVRHVPEALFAFLQRGCSLLAFGDVLNDGYKPLRVTGSVLDEGNSLSDPDVAAIFAHVSLFDGVGVDLSA